MVCELRIRLDGEVLLSFIVKPHQQVRAACEDLGVVWEVCINRKDLSDCWLLVFVSNIRFMAPVLN